MIDLKNPWGDGRPCSVYDAGCAFRECLNVGEIKGSFTQGRGYTSTTPKKDRKLVCMTRDTHGCPTPIPPVQSELMRCCPAPNFAKVREGKKPFWQRCRTCDTKFSTMGEVLSIVKALPILPHTDCKHKALEVHDWTGDKVYRCGNCDKRWDHEPQPFEIGETLEEFQKRMFDEWKKKNGIK